MRRMRLDPYLILLLVLVLPSLAPLAAPGYWFDAHDGRHSVFFLQMFDASIRDGALWPRWALHHNQGLGYPTFLIQAPLGFYGAEIFVLLGATITTAVKLAWLAGALAGAWGMYRLVIAWLRGEAANVWENTGGMARLLDGVRLDGVRLAAVAAGLIYTYLPYHFVGLYVRGALADTLLLAWLPWLILVFDRLLVRGAVPGWPRRLGVAALVLAGALLTHAFALLSIAPLVITLVLFRLIQQWRQRGFPLRTTLLAGAAGGLALLLYAVFLIPLLTEGQYLDQQVYVSNTYDYRNHFVQLGQFFSPFWGFGYSDDPAGANDGMSFQLGSLAVILAIAALFVVRRALQARAEMTYLLVIGGGLLFVMSPLSQPLWEAIPPLAVIQFPWRLLALAGFVFSALGGLVLWNLLPSSLPGPRAEGGLIVMSLLAMLASYPYIQAQISPVEPWREDGRAVYQFEREHPDMFGYTVWVTAPFTTTVLSAAFAAPDYVEHQGDAPTQGRLEIVRGEGRVTESHVGGSSAGGSVEMSTPGAVRLNVYYFPGWAVTVDGQPVEIAPDPVFGAIQFDLPTGSHRIDARFGETPVRMIAMLISAVALAVCLGLVLWPEREK
ncbi:hypothetical protein [Caldilinea sp.]|uniref:hypothetical protein n=1 Tax=Caldilinea sp. TaxID=2293560 RepID=UPI002BA8D505|nr:hypothetical protein [Anaerolineales bacterium]HQY91606.1 hypothetical protein [Caldilinea sp.]